MITNEHQDWHGNRRDYVKAKKSIVKNQTSKDFVVINKDFTDSKNVGEASKGKKYYFSTQKPVKKGAYIDRNFVISVTNGWTTIVDVSDIKILGEHNFQNVCAAVSVAGILSVQPEIVSKTIRAYRGLPHRLEFIKEINGVKFFDDSASTNPETAIAATRSFENPKVLILGGSSKNAEFSQLAKEIVGSNVKAIILMGEEADSIKDSVEKVGNFSGEIIEGLNSLRDIVEKAKTISEPGDVVLLSPACASFGLFENYGDRGNQFKEAIASKLN
jgi:UDP-N-acetylmuramoylalanine--D-glutamate ligase